MDLFNRSKRLQERVDYLERHIEDLLTERENIQDHNLELRRKNSRLEILVTEKEVDRKRFEEDLRHKSTMLDEKREVEWQKKEAIRELELEKARNNIKEEYRNKLEVALEKRGTEIREMYSEILTRLPDVNVMMGNGHRNSTSNDSD